MGCPIDGINVIDLDGGKSLDDDLVSFSVNKAKCFVSYDKHRLLAVVENAFGDHQSFDILVKELVQHRRGRLIRRSTGRLDKLREQSTRSGREEGSFNQGNSSFNQGNSSFNQGNSSFNQGNSSFTRGGTMGLDGSTALVPSAVVAEAEEAVAKEAAAAKAAEEAAAAKATEEAAAAKATEEAASAKAVEAAAPKVAEEAKVLSISMWPFSAPAPAAHVGDRV